MGFGLSGYIPEAIYYLWWIVIIISLFKVEIGLLFLIPLLPFQNLMDKLQVFPFGKDLIDILLVAILLGWCFKVLFKKDKLIEQTPFNIPIFILIILTYIGLWRGSYYLGTEIPIYTSDPRVMNWKNYMIIFLIYFMVINNIKEKKWTIILLVLMSLSMLVMDRWFFSTYKWVKAAHFSYRQRLSLGYLGPNVMAAFLGHYLFVFLGLLYFDKSKIRKVLFLAVILASLYTVLYSFSRSVYLGVPIGLIVFALIKDKRLLIPIVILLLFWRSILPISVVERITMTTQKDIYSVSESFDASTEGRVDVWQKSMELFKSNPLFGVGFQVIAFSGWTLRDTHNMYVAFLAEMGIIGLFLFLFLFWIALRNSWKLYRKSNDNLFKGLGLGVFVSVIVCMITNFFGDHWTYIQLGAFYWAFLALVSRGLLMVEEQSIGVKEN